MGSLGELPSYPRFFKIGAAASTIFPPVFLPLVINSPGSIVLDRSVLSYHNTPALWMLVETKRSQVRRNIRQKICHRRVSSASNFQGDCTFGDSRGPDC